MAMGTTDLAIRSWIVLKNTVHAGEILSSSSVAEFQRCAETDDFLNLILSAYIITIHYHFLGLNRIYRLTVSTVPYN